jgi:hypothetical protein
VLVRPPDPEEPLAPPELVAPDLPETPPDPEFVTPPVSLPLCPPEPPFVATFPEQAVVPTHNTAQAIPWRIADLHFGP